MSIEFVMRSISLDIYRRVKAGELVYGQIAESDAVGKDWGILAHILKNGEAQGAPPLAALAIIGGQRLEEEEDADYGGTRVLGPEEVERISRELDFLTVGEIERRYATLDFSGVYGAEGSLPASPLDDFLAAFEELRDFYRAAAECGGAMMVWLG
ncbi:DUF1877 family protein [Streptomyces sp. NPDC057413]|uniref:DUF1877 family protein n=1 Tax=unclassified Streptomyces TaxID=2593676 RepID=UPI0036661EB8